MISKLEEHEIAFPKRCTAPNFLQSYARTKREKEPVEFANAFDNVMKVRKELKNKVIL